jgi:DNA topoisomerase-2
VDNTDVETAKMVKKSITYVPGLYKIFDEILVNSLDHSVRLKTELAAGKEDVRPVKTIKVTIDRATGCIEIMNDGDGIDIVTHQEHNMYVPQLVFGELLTGTNYDKDEEKLWSGRNGYGSKTTNIFSLEFTVETVDNRRKKIYTQRFSNNMKSVDPPVIKSYTKLPYTKISFLPDYARFGMESMTDDIYQLFQKRVYDACATTDPNVTVYFNDTKIDIKSFERYVDLFIGNKATGQVRAFEVISDRWEIAATYSENGMFEQISFVNGIATFRGGKHIDAIVGAITKRLSEKSKKEIKPQHIKDNLMLFVKCLIVNPSFDTQTKEQLTTPIAKFGSKFEISDKFLAQLMKTGIVDRAMKLTEFHDKKKLVKTDGKKTSRVFIDDLDDANMAGTKKSSDCTLILTEGLSAKTMAVSGLSVVGRDTYGVFPLRGKLLNVKDMTAARVAENKEISNLKKAVGLQEDKEYIDIDDLRYGRIMIMTDADHDGSHIKGLLFNLFQSKWPSLLKRPGFITSMLTPIVKATRGGGGSGSRGTGAETMTFYNLCDFETWKEALPNPGAWKIRYLKGLGTSSEMEAKEYFRDMKLLKYSYCGQQSDEALDLAFNKKRADDRKAWLMDYHPQNVLRIKDFDVPVSYEKFVDEELKHYSMRDLERSLNSLLDGFKESTRKIMFAAFKRKLYNGTIKVAQFAAYVSEVSAYHHGETSLQMAIVGMAQTHIGANNINVLYPDGQFGTRLAGGKDAASPRYIYTAMSKLARLVFREEDLPILNYLNDDGIDIEPEFYIPIIPMILVNGGLGIGTGFSTNVPSYNPDDIINICKGIANRIIDGGDTSADIETINLIPWYLGFKGTIALERPGVYQSRGIYRWIDDTTVEVTELPIGTWTDDYKEFLTALLAGNSPVLKDFENHCTAKNVRFLLKFYPGVRGAVEPTFEKDFKMTSTTNLSINNIHLFCVNGAIAKFKDEHEVIKEWSKVRIQKYNERKEHQLKTLRYTLKIVSAKVAFIKEIIEKTLNIMNVKMTDLEGQLAVKGYPTSAETETDTETPDDTVTPTSGGYKYLTKMPIHHLTKEKHEELQRQANDLKIRIETLEARSIGDIWLEELNELQSEWQVFKNNTLAEYEADVPENEKAKAKAKGKAKAVSAVQVAAKPGAKGKAKAKA